MLQVGGIGGVVPGGEVPSDGGVGALGGGDVCCSEVWKLRIDVELDP